MPTVEEEISSEGEIDYSTYAQGGEEEDLPDGDPYSSHSSDAEEVNELDLNAYSARGAYAIGDAWMDEDERDNGAGIPLYFDEGHLTSIFKKFK